MGICLAVVSGKGGTGKSTVSYGLGVAFSALEKSVLLVDLDEGLRCLDVIAGIDDKVVTDLSDVLESGLVDAGIYESRFYEHLYVIPAPINTGSINYVNLSAFQNKIKDKFDVVIYDFPAGIDYDKLAALGDTAQFITVSNMDPVSLRDAAAIKNVLPETRREPRLIINRFSAEYIKDGVFKSIDDMINASELRLIGIVAGSVELTFLSLSHKLSKKGKPLASFKRIARRITGEEVKLPKPAKI